MDDITTYELQKVVSQTAQRQKVQSARDDDDEKKY